MGKYSLMGILPARLCDTVRGFRQVGRHIINRPGGFSFYPKAITNYYQTLHIQQKFGKTGNLRVRGCYTLKS